MSSASLGHRERQRAAVDARAAHLPDVGRCSPSCWPRSWWRCCCSCSTPTGWRRCSSARCARWARLNVNAYGFPALIAQIAVFFLAADVAGHQPRRHAGAGLSAGAGQVRAAAGHGAGCWWRRSRCSCGTFSASRPTSSRPCCARLFSGEAQGLSGDLAALPPLPAMIAFYGALAAGDRGSRLRRRETARRLCCSRWPAWRPSSPPSPASSPSCRSTSTSTRTITARSVVLKAEYGYSGLLALRPALRRDRGRPGGGRDAAVRPRAEPARHRPAVVRPAAPGVAAAGFALVAAVASFIVLHSNLILIEHETDAMLNRTLIISMH